MVQDALQESFNRLLQVRWPIVRYRLDWTVTRPILFPEYAGSCIRGAFGRALRKTACMTKMSDCRACPLRQTCPYTVLFETPAPEEHTLQKFSQIPHPYVIEAPDWGRKSYQAGDRFSFSIVLFGQAINQLALIVFALQRAFQHQVAGGSAVLNRVVLENDGHENHEIYDATTKCIAQHQKFLCLETRDIPKETIEIVTRTPIRLQENGVGLSPPKITAEKFFISLARRIGLVMELQCQMPIDLPFSQIKLESLDVELSKDIQWQDWVRYSSRQNQRMHLGGVAGTMQFSNVSPLLSLILYLGQWFHIGKNATFGLGDYRIQKE